MTAEAIELAVIQPDSGPGKDESAEVKNSSSEITEESAKLAMSATAGPEDESALIPALPVTIQAPSAVQPSAKNMVKAPPIWLGNTFAFCYYNGYPLFTIGPHCIIFFVYFSAFLFVWLADSKKLGATTTKKHQ